MSALRAASKWVGKNFAPLLLVPLAAILLWVGVWRVWLPPVHGGAVARTVTTVDARDASHKVTTIVKTSRAAGPSRRSEALALALVLLGAGAIVIAVFHSRIASVDLGKDGVKIELTAAERGGAALLAARLASRGAPRSTYGRAFERYLGAVGARRPAISGGQEAPEAVRAAAPGLSGREASSLAGRIADELA